MARLIFEKTGNAVWISHLDLMRLFQRAFKRAGLPLTHTQGFNPRPSVSIALPLSVGVQSHCELLEFELDGPMPPLAQMRKKLNDALVTGVRVLQIYDGGRKYKELAYLHCSVTLEYDSGIPEEGVEQIRALFHRETLLVEKKSKNETVQHNIIPMIRRLSVQALDANTVELDCMISCQNPTLNPMQILRAVEQYLPHWKPDHGICCRKEICTQNENVFR